MVPAWNTVMVSNLCVCERVRERQEAKSVGCLGEKSERERVSERASERESE